MSTHLLLEAAVRTLVMGAIIYAALRLLRIEQIRAQRTAWLLALAGALAMPLLVAAHIGPRLLPELAFAAPAAEAAKIPVQRYEDNCAHDQGTYGGFKQQMSAHDFFPFFDAAMRSARRCNSLRSSTAESTMPASSVSTEPSQNQSTIRCTALPATA